MPDGQDPGAGTTSSFSSSLLARLKVRDPIAWQRLSELYGPVVYRWARHFQLPVNDATDVVQEVFRSVARNIATFERERPGASFQAWLWTITKNKARDHFRRMAAQPGAVGGTDAYRRLQQIPEESESTNGSLVEPAGLGALRRRALQLIEAEFEPRSWQAFWRATVEGQAPADIARDLGMSVPAVYKAKSRILARIRQELSGLMD